MWHPASLLLFWVGFSLVLQWVPLSSLIGLAACNLFLAEKFARKRSRRLLWRSRWLLLSLAVIFLFLTPGEYLPGFAGELGLTFEGLDQAGIQLCRLLAILASLALLHEHIGTQGLLAGLYWMMGVFPWREATVVRLMLVLENVEQNQPAGWREWLLPGAAGRDTPGLLHLSLPEWHLRDKALLGVLLIMALMVVWL